MYNIVNFVYNLLQELSNILGFRIQGNQELLGESQNVRDTAQCSIFLPEITLFLAERKIGKRYQKLQNGSSNTYLGKGIKSYGKVNIKAFFCLPIMGHILSPGLQADRIKSTQDLKRTKSRSTQPPLSFFSENRSSSKQSKERKILFTSAHQNQTSILIIIATNASSFENGLWYFANFVYSML